MAFPFAAAGSLLSAGLGMKSASKAAKDQKKAQAVALSNAGQAYTPIDVFGPGGASLTFGGGAGAYDPTGMYGFQMGGMSPQTGQWTGSAIQPQIPTGGAVVDRGAAGTSIPGTPYFSDGKGGMQTEGGLEVVEGTRGRVKRTNIDQANVSAGDLDPLRQSQTGLATLLGQNMGLDQATQGLLGNYQNAAGIFGDAGLDVLGQLQDQGMLGQNMALQQLGQAGDFSNQLMGQAQGAFGALPGTQAEATQAAFDRMTELARPQEERAFSGLQDNLFATGRMGTSGGGLQTEAFARGLGQANTERQLAAMQEGRAAQAAQLGLGQGLASQGDALSQNAMSRFGTMTNMNQQLGLDRFNRSSDLANRNFARAGQLLQNSPQALQQAMLQSQLGNIGGALGNIGGINTNALNMAKFGQNLMAQQASARAGAAVPMAQMMNTAGSSNMANAGMFNQLAGALGQQAGPGGALGQIGGWLGGMFSGGGSQPAPSAGGYTAPSIMTSGGMNSGGFMPNPWD